MLDYWNDDAATRQAVDARGWMRTGFLDEFPMTVTGKIQKFRMREAAIAELGLQRAAGVSTA